MLNFSFQNTTRIHLGEGQIGAGVPQDWTTHMIGHELTGTHGIDHARTLSIVSPALMKVR